jgi:MOSC domain-containing protein YiiM
MVNDRQISIVSLEELAVIGERLGVGPLAPEWLGANIAISGILDVSHVTPDSRLLFPRGAVLLVSRTNRPCLGPGEVIAARTGNGIKPAAFPRAALHLRGLVARVERAGIIVPGDTMIVQLSQIVPYSGVHT